MRPQVSLDLTGLEPVFERIAVSHGGPLAGSTLWAASLSHTRSLSESLLHSSLLILHLSRWPPRRRTFGPCKCAPRASNKIFRAQILSVRLHSLVQVSYSFLAGKYAIHNHIH